MSELFTVWLATQNQSGVVPVELKIDGDLILGDGHGTYRPPIHIRKLDERSSVWTSHLYRKREDAVSAYSALENSRIAAAWRALKLVEAA